MNTKVALWLFVRALRWLAWIGFFAVAYYIYAYRAEAVTSFGQLKLHIEMLIFGTGFAVVFLGLIEMMTRERAGLRRPAFGELIPERIPPKGCRLLDQTYRTSAAVRRSCRTAPFVLPYESAICVAIRAGVAVAIAVAVGAAISRVILAAHDICRRTGRRGLSRGWLAGAGWHRGLRWAEILIVGVAAVCIVERLREKPERLARR